MNKVVALLACALLAASVGPWAQIPSAQPMTEAELVDVLKGRAEPDKVIALVNERGVDFDLTPEIEKRLHKAKATDEVIEAVGNQGPAARAARQAASGRPAVTPEESQAFQAISIELDPDRVIQMGEDFETKFPNSELLNWVYALMAGAHQQKGSIDRTLEYGEKSLQLNPENIPSLLIVSSLLPQPQLLTGSDLDKEKKLAQAETHAKHALELIEKLPARPNETPEAVAARKGQLAAEPHSSLGMVHLQRAQMSLAGPDPEELARAEEEYRKAVSLTPRPNPQDYFRLGETLAMEKKLDEAIEAFTKAGELGQGTIVEQYANRHIAEITKGKQETK